MYNCKKCGAEVPEGAKKCEVCGEKVKIKFKDLPKKQKIIRIVIACVCFLIAGVLMVSDGIGGASRTGSESGPYIEMVKSGTMQAFPEPTVGEAFEAFFSDTEWETFVSDEGLNVVEFSGGCTLFEEEATCHIQFVVSEDGTFETYYAEIDGVALTDNDIVAVYETIYGVESAMSYEEAIAYLYEKSALPYGMEAAVQAGVYSDVSVAEVLEYMFDEPQVDITVDDNGTTYVKFSGNYRYSMGEDFAYNGYVTYSISESGNMVMRNDGSQGIDLVIEGIAVQLAS